MPRCKSALLFAVMAWTAAAMAQAPATGQAPPTIEQVAEAGAMGTLTIHAVQGTKGAGPVGAADVQIDLLHRDQVIKRIDAKLDENGSLVVTEIPAAMNVTPMVRVKYDGVFYQDSGPALDAANPASSVTVTVYRTTDQAPAWRVRRRQISAKAVTGGTEVVETLTVDNPSDQTWIGGAPDAAGRRPCVVVGLPAGASEVQLQGGFHGWCCTNYSANRLTVQMPLMPGESGFRFAYRVPEMGGRFDLRVASPAPTDELSLSVGAELKAEAFGVTPQPSTGQGAAYVGRGVAAGVSAGVVLASMSSGAGFDTAQVSQIVGGVGVGLAVLIGAVLFFRRSTGRRKQA